MKEAHYFDLDGTIVQEERGGKHSGIISTWQYVEKSTLELQRRGYLNQKTHDKYKVHRENLKEKNPSRHESLDTKLLSVMSFAQAEGIKTHSDFKQVYDRLYNEALNDPKSKARFEDKTYENQKIDQLTKDYIFHEYVKDKYPDLAKIVNRYADKNITNGKAKIRKIKAVTDTIIELSNEGILIGVYSSGGKDYAEKHLKKIGLEDYIKAGVHDKKDFGDKSKIEAYDNLIKHAINLGANEIYYHSDSPEEVSNFIQSAHKHREIIVKGYLIVSKMPNSKLRARYEGLGIKIVTRSQYKTELRKQRNNSKKARSNSKKTNRGKGKKSK